MAQYIAHKLYLFAEILILDYFILAVKLDKLCHFHVWQPLQILIDNGGVIFGKTAILNEIPFITLKSPFLGRHQLNLK